jgi:single-stranded DNA-binding protein
MANDLNNATITGRLGKNPILKTSDRGSAYVTFSVASERESNLGGSSVITWVNITLWGADLALPVARRINKGDHVTVVGRIQSSFDREANKSFFGITAEDVQKTNIAGVQEYKDDLNNVAISGRLGRDAKYDLVGPNKDKPMLTFSVANGRETDYSEQTTWIHVVAWGPYARELSSLRSLVKGQHVTIYGSIETHLSDVKPRQIGEAEPLPTLVATKQVQGQIVATRVAINDRSNHKRAAGYGNGAESFSHYSQRSSFDRYTNEMQDDVFGSGSGSNYYLR